MAEEEQEVSLGRYPFDEDPTEQRRRVERLKFRANSYIGHAMQEARRDTRDPDTGQKPWPGKRFGEDYLFETQAAVSGRETGGFNASAVVVYLYALLTGRSPGEFFPPMEVAPPDEQLFETLALRATRDANFLEVLQIVSILPDDWVRSVLDPVLRGMKLMLLAGEDVEEETETA